MKRSNLLSYISALTVVAFGQNSTPTVTASAEYIATYPPSLAFGEDKKIVGLFPTIKTLIQRGFKPTMQAHHGFENKVQTTENTCHEICY